MSNPKKHHFVPRSYLEAFTDNSGFLHLYSRRNGLWRKQKPNRSMVITNYYRQEWAPAGIDQYVLEKAIGCTVEPLGLNSLRKLCNSSLSLNEDDSAAITVYLEFQRTRVPRQADTAKSLAKTALTIDLAKSAAGLEVLENGEISIKDSFRFNFMKMVSGKFLPYFQRMIWEVVEAEGGAEFITSDSPVTFLNEKVTPPSEPGVSQYGTMVVFPINKKYILLLKHPEYDRLEKEALEVLETTPKLEDGVIELRFNKWDEEMVKKQNWFMYMQSQDLIAGSSKSILETTLDEKLSGHR